MSILVHDPVDNMELDRLASPWNHTFESGIEKNMFKTSHTILFHRMLIWELRNGAIQRRTTQLKSWEVTTSPLEWLTLKPPAILSAGQDGELLKHAPTNPWEGWELPRRTWKAAWHFLIRWNIHLPWGPAIPLLEVYLRERNSYICTKTCVRLFRAAWFIPENSKQPTLYQLVTG